MTAGALCEEGHVKEPSVFNSTLSPFLIRTVFPSAVSPVLISGPFVSIIRATGIFNSLESFRTLSIWLL